MMRRILMMAALTVIAAAARSQNAGEDFRKMNSVYQASPGMSMEVTYRIYTDHTTRKAREVFNGVIRKKGKHEYRNMLQMVSLQNEKYQMIVDSSSKMIIVRRDEDVQKASQDLNAAEIVALLQEAAEVKYSEQGAQKMYKLNFRNKTKFEYSSVEIYMNKKSYLLEKLVLFSGIPTEINPEERQSPKSKHRIEITYSNINTKPSYPSDFFSESRYVQVTEDGLRPAPEYYSYEIIDHTRNR
jgi:hypothetical protein